MSGAEMSKRYDPRAAEEWLYEFWEQKGYFTPEIDRSRRPFVIIMPPPNVTGELHNGHALFVALEDIMTRWHRMLGEPTLWLPGSDHASIAVHYVIEKGLAERDPVIMELIEELETRLPEEEMPITRHDLGRERFLELAWAWKRKYGGIITQQLRRLGASCDWTRERFTMDPGPALAVRTAFVRLYQRGLIYRGERLIHWCPNDQTSLSDLEVEHQEERGRLWTVRYPLKGGGHLEVATTRPETILGDTAIAVHPEDDRYAGYAGKTALVPFLDRPIPVIEDETVDSNFGTGAVKVTPGHDPNDWEIGQRQDLPVVNIMNMDGTLTPEAGPYAGLDRYEAREKLVGDLERAGLLAGVQDHPHAPGRCYRCQTLVEPLVSEQWFVKIRPLAEPATEAVRDGRIRIVPERFTKVYYNWMENIRDWNISRQLWWGHRIPVWYCDACGEMTVSVEDPTECAHCGSANIHQDPDILDTWFSSGLWPLSTLGWPNEDSEDLAYFYPTSVLETGYDILFFWVARMIMLGMELAGEVPFRAIYLHGMVRDERGQTMSKTKGNVINPLTVMDIYGSDALRFALITSGTPGMDLKLAEQRVEDARNLANKIWNMARFITANLPDGYRPPSGDPEPGSPYDRWILSRHNRLIVEVDRLMERFQFGEAGRHIQEFLWGEFADWYIEAAKVDLYGEDPRASDRVRHILVHIFERTLRLFHPFMPFLTEEIWQHLPHEGEALIVAPWPTANSGLVSDEAESQQEEIWELIREIRHRKASEAWPAGEKPDAFVEEAHDALTEQEDVVKRLAGLNTLQQGRTGLEVTPIVTTRFTVHLGGQIQLDRDRQRLALELAEIDQRIARSRAVLGHADFRAKAPRDIVESAEQKLADLKARRDKLRGELDRLQSRDQDSPVDA